MGEKSAHQHQHHTIEAGEKHNNSFKLGITLNLVFVAAEFLFGYLSNSMALVADAGHNLSDVLALAFSWIAVYLSGRKPTARFTYGFKRSTILIALVNTVLLLAAVAIIGIETIHRLNKPATINSASVIVVAALGIVINGFTAWLFMKDKKDLNIRSTYVHFFADALVSLGVVVAGVVILLTGLVWVDQVVSFAIIAVILYSTYHLLIDSVNLALDAVPESIDISAVQKYFDTLPGILNHHDLHIWPLGTSSTALTVHIVTQAATSSHFYQQINKDLLEQFGIEHVTIQAENGDQTANCETDC